MIAKLWKYYQGSKTVSTLKDESILLGKWQMLKHKYWVKWSQQKSQIIIKLLLNYLHVILFSLLQVTSSIFPSPEDRIPAWCMVNFLHRIKSLLVKLRQALGKFSVPGEQHNDPSRIWIWSSGFEIQCTFSAITVSFKTKTEWLISNSSFICGKQSGSKQEWYRWVSSGRYFLL